MNVLAPSAGLLCKLGSIAVHAQELVSPDSHQFDHAALASLLTDPEIRAWLIEMDTLALVPKMRRPQS